MKFFFLNETAAPLPVTVSNTADKAPLPRLRGDFTAAHKDVDYKKPFFSRELLAFSFSKWQAIEAGQ